MNTELLKKLLAAGVSADEAITLASETKGAPEDRVTAVVEQMAKSLNQQPLVDRLSAIEATLGKLTTAMTTIIPNALEAQTTAFDSMQKSLTPLQEQMSTSTGASPQLPRQRAVARLSWPSRVVSPGAMPYSFCSAATISAARFT